MSEIPTINSLPDFPDALSQGADFNAKATAFAAALNPFGNQIGAVAEFVAGQASASAAAVAAGELAGLNFSGLAGRYIRINDQGDGVVADVPEKVSVATQSQAITGTTTNRYISPFLLHAVLEELGLKRGPSEFVLDDWATETSHDWGHDLGGYPTTVSVFLEAKVDAFGYVAGDRVAVNNQAANGASSYSNGGVSVAVRPTIGKVTIGRRIQIFARDTFEIKDVAASTDWRLVILLDR